MGRRKNGAADALFELFALLPWWVGVVAAIVSYLVLHKIAGMPIGKGATPAELSGLLQRSVFAGLATVGQYIVPLICIGGAIASFFGRRKRGQLVTDVASKPDASALNGISWREFELLVGEAFRLRGYTVDEIGGGGADGGVDLVLHKGGHTFFVQCKQWKTSVVGVEVVRELFGVMAARKADGGFVVTSGRFTPAAKDFAQGKRLHLMDGEELHQMLRSVRGVQPGAARSVEPPSCPRCGESMILRTTYRGANVGSKF
ncbi:restriction endonuclease [Ramlibacter albus]|uniref:Restriction endonuclease n=1 Tax=Ramlibacter albus TaxID=2079448 RepID=A0A923MCX0_9BURK|nr:restriction endonuclease [Ramlibacter albus]MBC5767231.1 restriction endonuclease [Ramlibacter albus]